MSTTTPAETAETRTITMTGRPPVRIREGDWPVSASAPDRGWDGEFEFQANRKWKAALRVRKHSDGRAIVYGTYDYATCWQGERDIRARAGSLLTAGGDVPATIAAVGADLIDAGAPEDVIHRLVRECIADLPPEEL